MDAENTIRWLEPIFGSAHTVYGTFSNEASNLRRELHSVFGQNGGVIMDFVCGEMTLQQYIMKCDIVGETDYHIEYLKRIVDVFEEFSRAISRKRIMEFSSSTVTEAWCDMFNSRLRKLKFDISLLNRKWIDNV